MPWLSVVVPVFNGRRYLAAALDSVLAEADDEVEVLVSDDGSSDGSVEIIDCYARRGRVTAIDGPRIGNWVANTNRAVERSRGHIVTFLHQDDVWLPGRLSRLRTLCTRDEPTSLWLGPARFISATGRIVGTWRLPFGSNRDQIGPDAFVERLLIQNFVAMPAPAFTREAFQSLGGMDEDLWYTADWDLWVRLASRAAVAIDNEPRVCFRLHRESQTMAGIDAAEAMRTQSDTVRTRHLWRIADTATRQAVERAGRFSTELSTALACSMAGQPIRWQPLAVSFARLGLGGLYRFARDARIVERISARLRARATER